MPTRLTPEQRTLYSSLLAQGDLSGAGAPLDSGAFARKMLQPSYVEMVRKHITGRPGRDSADSAAFYETYRSPVVNVGLTNDDLTPPKITSSKEGTYDTLRFQALGDIPAHTRVEFRPSVNQRVKDMLGDIPEAGSRLLQRALRTDLRDLDAISGAAARPKAPTARDTLDAKTTNGTPRKR